MMRMLLEIQEPQLHFSCRQLSLKETLHNPTDGTYVLEPQAGNNSITSDVWRFGVLVSFAEFALRIGLLVQVTPEARVLIEGCPKENLAVGAARVCCSLQGRLNFSEGKRINLTSSSLLRAQSCLNNFSLTATPKDFVGRSWKSAGSQAAKTPGHSGSTFWLTPKTHLFNPKTTGGYKEIGIPTDLARKSLSSPFLFPGNNT